MHGIVARNKLGKWVELGFPAFYEITFRRGGQIFQESSTHLYVDPVENNALVDDYDGGVDLDTLMVLTHTNELVTGTTLRGIAQSFCDSVVCAQRAESLAQETTLKDQLPEIWSTLVDDATNNQLTKVTIKFLDAVRCSLPLGGHRKGYTHEISLVISTKEGQIEALSVEKQTKPSLS